MVHLLTSLDIPTAHLAPLWRHAGEWVDYPPVDKPLQGQCWCLAMLEPSTRTRLSFALALERLGARVVTLERQGSSLEKGETVQDTLRTVAAMPFDGYVIRLKEEGLLEAFALEVRRPVVSAGEGVRHHPTQALLDAGVLWHALGSPEGGLEGARLVLAGDLAYSRVAHSTTELWETLGGTVRRIGLDRVKDDAAWEEALAGGVEAVMMLRTQHERREPGVLSASLPSQPWLTVDRLDRLSPLAWVMHPGPVHWGCELAMEFRDDRRSLIDTQVRYGVGLRMACLYWLVQQRYAVIREVFEDALTSEDAGMVP